MKLVRRDPDKGYIDTWLWLPKTEVSRQQIVSALAYTTATQEVHAWRETPHHFLVPRNYLGPETLARLSFPIVDARFMDFPKTSLRSKVVLDMQLPELTYQKDSVSAIQSAYDGVLCLRCGGGKSVIALHAAVDANGPILIIVDELSLAKQWIRTIKSVLDLDDPIIGVVGDGKCDWKHSITVATVHSLARLVRAGEFAPLSQHFAIAIFDESHTMGAPTFNTVVNAIQGRRWGLSATPHREDAFDSLLKFSLGKIVFTYLMPETRPHFYFLQLPTPKLSGVKRAQASDSAGRFHYASAYGVLAQDVRRTAAILKEVRLALASGRTCLVLTHSRAMCETLAAALPGSGVVHGNVSGTKRLDRVAKCNPIVAIMKIGEKALDKPNLDTVFIVDPVAREGRLQQIMGRALRLKSNKKHPTIIFCEDYNIKEMKRLANKARRALNEWPDEQGGAIPFARLSPGHENPKTRAPAPVARTVLRRK